MKHSVPPRRGVPADLGISKEKAVELLAEHWNPHCQPPWEIEDLELKVSNAAEYQQNDRRQRLLKAQRPTEVAGAYL